jgi:hypothetical protein
VEVLLLKKAMNLSLAASILLLLLLEQLAQAVEPFQDVTQQAGLDGLSGDVAAWGDFDRDGYVDLYVAGQLWKNEKGTRFRRVADVPLAGAAIWGDYDNDGWLDLYSWSDGGKLFRNLEGRGFADVSDRTPRLPGKVSLGAAWGDFNGDGFIDLYVGGYEIWPSEEFPTSFC